MIVVTRWARFRLRYSSVSADKSLSPPYEAVGDKRVQASS